MPTPRRTSIEEIVSAGRRILEVEGLEGLSMQRVATVVGVRPPSLYKHVRDRGDLIRLIANDVARELGERLDATESADPRAAVRAMARLHRAFARANPQAYRLLFAHLPAEWRPDDAHTRRAMQALLRAVERLAGGKRTLEAARTVVAWAHGFVTMELAGAFRMGGDVDEAFDYGIERLIEALAATGSRRRSL